MTQEDLTQALRQRDHYREALRVIAKGATTVQRICSVTGLNAAEHIAEFAKKAIEEGEKI